MDMHQGQMCKLKRREDSADIGLYIRLRSSDGQQRYYRVAGGVGEGQAYGDQMINFSDVDSTNNNKPEMASRPYVVTCIVPTEIQVKALMVNPSMDVAAEVSRGAILFDIQREKKTIDNQIESLSKQMEAYRALEDQMGTLRFAAEELNNIMESVERGEKVNITYAYGVHPTSPKEFCWRVPSHMVDQVRAGLTAVGDTAFGPKEFTITRIETMERLLPHRLLLSVDELHCHSEL